MTFFRTINVRDLTLPPTAADFPRHNQEKPNYHYSDERSKIMGYGVSTWSKLSKLKKVKAKYPAPEQFGDKLIAFGELVPELGVIHKSKPDYP